ncbi:uncharacterized protein LOC144437805 [Glandiceps talaboti]
MKTLLVICVFVTVFTVTETGTTHYITTVNFSNRCGGSSSEYGILLQSHGQSGSFDFFNTSLNCPFTFNAKSPYDRVMLEFRHFDISVRYADPSVCTMAYMNIHDGSSTSAAFLKEKICGSSRPDLTLSTGSSMTIDVVMDGNNTVMDFQAVLTAFRDETGVGACPDLVTDFHCETTKRCISTEMTCLSPNISNCGDGDYSDQSKNAPLSCNESPDYLPLWIVLGILAGLVPFLIYWCCWRPGYVEWLCGCWRHKRCIDPCKWCSRGSRNFCRAVCAGPRGCSCCGPRNVSDSSQSGNGYNKMGTGPSSKKGVFVTNYTNSGPVYGNSPSPWPSNSSKGDSDYDATSGLHTRESRY